MATPPPARMLVFASEHHLNPSRRRLPAGRVIVQMRNNGEDAHDLVIRRVSDGRVVAAMAEIRPGRTGELRTRLRAGRYQLVCTVTGHEALGMVAAFTVTRRGRS